MFGLYKPNWSLKNKWQQAPDKWYVIRGYESGQFKSIKTTAQRQVIHFHLKTIVKHTPRLLCGHS